MQLPIRLKEGDIYKITDVQMRLPYFISTIWVGIERLHSRSVLELENKINQVDLGHDHHPVEFVGWKCNVKPYHTDSMHLSIYGFTTYLTDDILCSMILCNYLMLDSYIEKGRRVSAKVPYIGS